MIDWIKSIDPMTWVAVVNSLAVLVLAFNQIDDWRRKKGR